MNAGILETVFNALTSRIKGVSVAHPTSVQEVDLWLTHYAAVSSNDEKMWQTVTFSRAKEAADEYGLFIAERQQVRPTDVEIRFFGLTSLSNWMLRNPIALEILISYANQINPQLATSMHRYVTENLDDAELTQEGCAFTWSLAQHQS